MFWVVTIGEQISVPYGDFTGAVLTLEWTPLEPKVVDRKYYVQGIGVVLEASLAGPEERSELVSVAAPRNLPERSTVVCVSPSIEDGSPMNASDVAALFDYTYWADRRLLEAAAELSDQDWRATSTATTRGLRATLVHTLDVEWSWRVRLQGRPEGEWGPEAELSEDDFPTVASLTARWAEDEREMRAWLDSLSDGDIASAVDLGGRDRFPLWHFLTHIIVHSTIQRADAAALLSQLGHSPGDLEFLDWVDATRSEPA